MENHSSLLIAFGVGAGWRSCSTLLTSVSMVYVYTNLHKLLNNDLDTDFLAI